MTRQASANIGRLSSWVSAHRTATTVFARLGKQRSLLWYDNGSQIVQTGDMAKRRWLRSGGKPQGLALVAAAATAIALLCCGGDTPLTAVSGATLTIAANPTAISAEGGVSTITVLGFKSSEDGGGPLSNGTDISFATTVGTIEERVEMRDGIARAYLRSDGRPGTATVTARSGGAEPVTVDVLVGDTGNFRIIVSANPATVGPPDFTTEIVATVFDDANNRVPDVPLLFSTTSGVLASQGTALRTNANGQASDRLVLANEISATVTVTSGSSSGSVTVSRRGETTPVVSSVTPSSGSLGASLTVTVSGMNFQPGAAVNFGDGISTRSVEFIDPSTLRVDITIDSQAREGYRNVTVINPDGASGSLVDAFRVGTGGGGSPTIVVSGVNPNVGAQGETLDVTISGTGFRSGAASSFGAGILVNSTTFVSSTQLIANITIVATAAPGPRDVRVQNQIGQSDELPNGFNVVAPPLITGVNPDNGDPGDALTVFILGANFASGVSVSFGADITIDDVRFIDPALIEVDITILATATPGPRDVTVTNLDGGTGTGSGGFTVN
jgi:hypothetical protein